MPALIFTFLKAHWQTALIVSLVASVTAAFSLERFEVRHLKRELAQCHGENAALENSNEALLASIQRQNAAIAALKVLALKKQEAAASSMTAARAHADTHAQRAQGIMAAKASGDECADMRGLVDGFVHAH
jgi:hypothetical protein